MSRHFVIRHLAMCAMLLGIASHDMIEVLRVLVWVMWCLVWFGLPGERA